MDFLIKTLIKKNYCVERHFIIIWTSMNFSLFELYLKLMSLMYFI